MRVRVYKNLHRDCYSVVSTKTNRVLCYLHLVVLKDVTFIVRSSGRAKVLREKRKNVHAFVQGELVQDPQTAKTCHRIARYNPYEAGFFQLSNGRPVRSAAAALLDERGLRICRPQ